MQNDIFRKFCHYVDEHIFSKENMGSYVAFIVDQYFIDEFCKNHHTTENELVQSVRKNLWAYISDHYTTKGFAAIQLFAATKRANSGGVTENNYRIRLAEVLQSDVQYVDNWFKDYQDDVWAKLYKWCEDNSFSITKCIPRPGKGRYVQYPLNQAKRVFTTEDLLYIAKCFVDRKLFPGEDITSNDFWKIINRYALTQYLTNHGFEVIYNSIKEKDYMSQIYNFYLRWDGKYKYREKVVRIDSTLSNLYLYLTEDLARLELRDENLKLLCCYSTDNINYHEAKNYFQFKWKGLLLFKKDDIYDDRWQEVRYIDAEENDYTKESGNYAIAVCFRNELPDELGQKLKIHSEVLLRNKHIIIYKIIRRTFTEKFFTKKRNYELYGGLKIGKNTYLKGALPILRLHKSSIVWIDGQTVEDTAIEGDYLLNHLSVGSHLIKLPETKSMKLDVVETSASILEWEDNYNKWQIKKEPAKWESKKQEQGIVGLDFSLLSDSDNTLDGSITKRWAKALTFGKYHKSENNIAINITKQYDERV
jgi:hypothetical protein